MKTQHLTQFGTFESLLYITIRSHAPRPPPIQSAECQKFYKKICWGGSENFNLGGGSSAMVGGQCFKRRSENF